MALTILEGATFCICDERGDVGQPTEGFFTLDTRFLSRCTLEVNGRPPLPLSHGKVDYFSAAFYLRNPPADGLDPDAVSIVRERFVGRTMRERIVAENRSMQAVSLDLHLALSADFADIMAVKAHDFALGDPHAAPLPPPRPARWNAERCCLVFADVEGSDMETHVVFTLPGERTDAGMRYRLTLEPRRRWELQLDVLPVAGGAERPVDARPPHFGEEVARVRDSLAAWHVQVPALQTSWDELGHCFDRSVADLASLRMRGTQGQLPAAGMPWFMTVFGRDTIITSLQTLLFGPDLARGALETLADLQAHDDDASIDAEPGKIPHEVRHGKAAESWFPRYYGTLDATPLYLVLLSELWRWTGDDDLLWRLRGPALAALEWIDRSGDRDGDGLLEYERRTPRGLLNQSWKDSGDSQRFADGRLATGPIAPCEVQGYAYDAKLRMAEIARDVWRDRELAARLEREAAALREHFHRQFWVDTRGGYYALALDGDKTRVDATCSNMGHLLWSGIVPDERVDQVVDRLMADSLWSGWGIRTMSTDDAGYNPLTYHNGTVWPHDNSLIAAGLARYGRWAEARRIVRGMLQASSYFNYELPEVFAGFPRSETPFPIAYPTAARPQAWAAGAPVLLLQVLLGLQPDVRRQRLASVAPGDVPDWAGRIALGGVCAFGRRWNVTLGEGAVRVAEA